MLKTAENHENARGELRSRSSKKQIKYRRSSWQVNQFEVWSGSLVCRVAVLRMQDSLLLWLGGGGAPELGEVALGMPGAGGRAGVATALLAGGAAPHEGGATALARRLSAALGRPVYVCCALTFDRFTMPLVEKGLIAEIKSRPECF